MGELREASLTISPQPGGGLVQLEVARQLQEETIPAHLTLPVCVCVWGGGTVMVVVMVMVVVAAGAGLVNPIQVHCFLDL